MIVPSGATATMGNHWYEPFVSSLTRIGVLQLAPGLVDVRVEASELGYAPAEVHGVRVELGVRNTVRVALPRGLALALELAPPPGDVRVYLCAPADAYPDGSELGRRRLAFDAFGAARLEGLTPGVWRFAAEPDELAFEPAVVTLPCDEPLFVRVTRRE